MNLNDNILKEVFDKAFLAGGDLPVQFLLRYKEPKQEPNAYSEFREKIIEEAISNNND